MRGRPQRDPPRLLGPDRGRLLRALRIVGIVLAIGLVPLAAGVVLIEHAGLRREREKLDSSLANGADAQKAALEAYFGRARAIVLVLAENPSFRSLYHASGSPVPAVAARGTDIDRVNTALAYLERLYPESIGEACLIDATGPELARAVKGERAPVGDLSPDETGAPFFRPTFRLPPGRVHHARPYVSPDTEEWVIANATPLRGLPPGSRAIVHFEVTIESFRRAAAEGRGRFDITVVDGRTGRVVFDAAEPQRVGAPLGRPGDDRFVPVARAGQAEGALDLEVGRAVYRRLRRGRDNANDWYVVASAPRVARIGVGAAASLPALVLLAILLAIGIAVANRWLRRGDEAATDPLTGLPNRRRFSDRIDQALTVARREGHPLTLMLIDLDRFKEVNDALGHHFGDILLQQVAARLRQSLRESDTVARLGGDEFAVLLPRVRDRAAAVEVAEKLRLAIARPLELTGELTLEVEGSAGIALFPEHGDDSDELMRRADVAMYVAKAARSGQEVYAPDQDQGSMERLSLVGELRRAIEQGELIVHYQPKVVVGTGETRGVEALVRWKHPSRGLLAPAEFIPLAERTSLIKPLTLFVLERALSDAQRWEDDGVSLSVSINLSANHLSDPSLPDDVAGLLAASEMDPSRLELEITETTLMIDPVRALAVLGRLSAMGIKLSIDDFGVGYSSLNYLKKLPIDLLKIDRSFVMNMELSREDEMIVRSTIDLARNLGLQTVAEGVESAGAMERLRDLGCDVAQGFHLGRPMPPEQLVDWIRLTELRLPAPPA